MIQKRTIYVFVVVITSPNKTNDHDSEEYFSLLLCPYAMCITAESENREYGLKDPLC
jgi:hypothetical protein